MAKSLFGNVYDVNTDAQSDREKSALSLAALPRGRVQVAGAGMAGGMLGKGAMEGMGYKSPAQQKQQTIDEVFQSHGHLDLDDADNRKKVGNAFLAKGLPDIGMDILEYDDGTDQKKWDFEQRGKRDAIRREAERRGYTLTESQVNDIAIATPLSAKMNQLSGTMIHPWMDTLNSVLARMKPTKNKTDVEPTASSVETGVTTAANTKALQSMNTAFTKETKDLKENISTVESGINIVNQVRDGNIAALPQLSKMLAKINSDNRISVPEVAQVMKMGGLGTRITDSIHKFLGGDLSPGTLNDIEEMLVRIGQLDQGNYNAKMSQYKVKYGDRFDDKTLDKWLPASVKPFLTKAQLLEIAKEKIKQRGL